MLVVTCWYMMWCWWRYVKLCCRQCSAYQWLCARLQYLQCISTKPSIYGWYFVCLVMVWYCSVLSLTVTVTLLVLLLWYHGSNASKVALDSSRDSSQYELGVWLKRSHKSSKKYQYHKEMLNVFLGLFCIGSFAGGGVYLAKLPVMDKADIL